MTVETSLITAIGSLVGGRLFPDTAALNTSRPFATYQQVGGEVINPIGGSVPNLRNSRIQINVWAATRAQANTLMRQVEDTLRPYPYEGRPEAAAVSTYEETTRLYGAMQDFSFWWT